MMALDRRDGLFFVVIFFGLLVRLALAPPIWHHGEAREGLVVAGNRAQPRMDLAVAQWGDTIETAVLPLAGGVTGVCLWAKRLGRSPAHGKDGPRCACSNGFSQQGESGFDPFGQVGAGSAFSTARRSMSWTTD